MIAILKIGTAYFAMAPKEATKVLELMSSALRVEQAYHKGKYCYHPPDERCYRDNLELAMIQEDQMLASEPRDDAPTPPPLIPQRRRIGPGRPQLPAPGSTF